MAAARAPREDLGLREGYHSPQVEVEVRLNTNESPLPPPPAWVEALQRGARPRSSGTAIPTAARRDLRAALAGLHGVARRTGVLRQRVQRGAAVPLPGLRRPGPVGGGVRAHLRPALAHRPPDGDRGGRGPAPVRFFPGSATRSRDVLEAGTARPSPFCARPTTPPDWPTTRPPCGPCSTLAPGLVVVDEAYGQFADWSALTLVDDAVPLVVTRTFSKTWSMAAARLGYLVGPAPVVADLERVALPVSPRRPEAGGGPAGGPLRR